MVNVNIGIDGGALAIENENQKSGVFRYNFLLLKELSRLDKKNNYYLYTFRKIPDKVMQDFGKNFHNKIFTPSIAWNFLGLPYLIHQTKPDIFLGLSQSLPLHAPKRNIVYFYDLAFNYYDKAYPHAAKLTWQSRLASAKAKKIIVPSQSTASDLAKLYHIKQDKIKIIQPGIENNFYPRDEKEIVKIKKKYMLKKEYLLYVGRLTEIKNITGLVKAYSSLPNSLKGKYDLVLVGRGNKNYQGIKQLGFVNEKDLPVLYSGAKLFISPSFYEGFGFPMLEAISCGCPVIAGINGSASEIVDKAGLLVDPKNISDIKNKIESLLTDEKLYQKVKSETLREAQKFSLEKFGREVYNEIEVLNSNFQ